MVATLKLNKRNHFEFSVNHIKKCDHTETCVIFSQEMVCFGNQMASEVKLFDDLSKTTSLFNLFLFYRNSVYQSGDMHHF